MRRLYLVLPIVATAAFAVIYLPAVGDIAAQETAKADAKVQAERVAAEKQRGDLEAARAKEAERKLQRASEEKAAAEKLSADHEAAISALKEKLKAVEADKTAADRALAAAKTNTEKARTERIAAQEQVFQARKENELQRIAIRSAELNSQRLIEMLAARAGTTLPPHVSVTN